MQFHSLGLSGRLYAIVALVLTALASVLVFAWLKLGAVAEAASDTAEVRVPQLGRIAAIELNITRVSLQVRHAMLSRSPEELAATLADIGEKRRQIEQLMADYERAITTGKGRKLFRQLEPAIAGFWQTGGANLKLVQDGQRAEAFAFLVEKTIPARNLVLQQAEAMVQYQRGMLEDELAGVSREGAATLRVLAVLVAAAMVGLTLFAWRFVALLQRRLAASRAVADRVRDGDLTQPVLDTARDEFSPLLNALQQMQDSLAHVVGTVRQSADGVATASTEISTGNHDLSRRTEQQASSLQQTAASMEQLGGTVRQNADNARQANQLAQGASRVALEGGQVVAEVVGTMKGIHDSSHRIADIIGTIDGIAFQTNILALNAAVEAARAGDQGRGFAVVAGEVRTLAQRSAEAAREIKGLITASVEQVAHGNTLAERAGGTMDQVVAAIQRVTDIMGEISAASTEQSSGVNQVGAAVTQMDQVTQQNAALVEQSAAAAESLKQQATQLVQAVAVFKLGRA
ncbi:methyl-accepting chemotaxis protein [Rubrivivax rivuli]|uniref:HAMP domain-containing protein n=1 Tax=Rubrivivax rivuli TaxID=1862385 RepID=A0A437RAB5_9BURK|nr:methyl-accepting chemotaxis protein [Rubrivivax rivuli]RVU43721.1 HAMP domain-containing protein [Rubrivivax rivuli]